MEWVGGEALVPGYKGKREPPYSQKVMGGRDELRAGTHAPW